MSKLNQKEAVYNAVTKVFEENELNFESGDNASESMTTELRAQVIGIVVEGFSTKTIELSDDATTKYDTDAKLKSYTSGLVSNWLRKDKRLNGNTIYKAKNPGSRVGSTNPELKALRQLFKQFKEVDAEKAAEIQTHIDEKVKTIQTAKAKKVEINMDLIPDELKEALDI